MTMPCFSLNANGNRIDVRSEGFWKPRVIISYNGEPLMNERRNGTAAYEFSVDEEESNTVYKVELDTVLRTVCCLVKRNDVLLPVTEYTRDWILSREK